MSFVRDYALRGFFGGKDGYENGDIRSLTLTADGASAADFITAVKLAFDVKNGFYAKGSKDNPNPEEAGRAIELAYCGIEYAPVFGCSIVRYKNGIQSQAFTISAQNFDFLTKVGDVFYVVFF